MIQTTSLPGRYQTYKLTELSLFENSSGLDISQCTDDFMDDSLKGAPLTRRFTGADLSEMGPWMMRSYPKEVSSLVNLTAGSGSLRFLYISVGFSLFEGHSRT